MPVTRFAVAILNVFMVFALSTSGAAAGQIDSDDDASAGDISSVFNSLRQETFQWPERFAALKKELVPSSDHQLKINGAWKRLNKELDVKLAQLAELQERSIPVVTVEAIRDGLDAAALDQVRASGCVVVRGVIDAEQARGFKTRVQEYSRAHPSHRGFPADNPQVLELYWSRPQVEARQHPNVYATLVALNHIWSQGSDKVSSSVENESSEDSDLIARAGVDLDTVYTYGERLRIRQPFDTSFRLGPHMDGGSIERFEDPNYRQAYAPIFEGNWEQYFAWGAAPRALANYSLYQGAAANGACSVFRTFQGWLAVSSIGSGPAMGSLRLLPLLREATAYVLMRPFLDDVAASDFCGAVPGRSQELLPEFHDRLVDALVPIPAMEPGDMVFWHPDLIHAVQEDHHGSEDSSVFYIPAMPGCVLNQNYAHKQAQGFLEGRTPPDFPPNHSERSYDDRGKLADLSDLGRKMMGIDLLDHVRAQNTQDREL